MRVAIRLLADRIPSLEALGLPAAVAGLAQRHAGLVLFTGPTGSGKTTALAALIDRINRTSERVVCTVEDPVEYVHHPQRSFITHCEIGRDVSDYAEALRGFMRADPDVILVGEMRDRPTMEAALTAAETGHLVFATLHTGDAAADRRPHRRRVPGRSARAGARAARLDAGRHRRPAAGAAPRRARAGARRPRC